MKLEALALTGAILGGGGGMREARFKETEIGMIPEDWRLKPLEDLSIEIIDGDRGKNYPNGNDFSDSGYCLFLNTKNVPNTVFNFAECVFITKEKDQLLRKGKLKRNDIVLTTRGTVGNIAFYDESVPFDKIRINSGMVVLRNNEKEFFTQFLYQLLKSPLFNGQVLSSFSGSAQPQLPIRDLKKILLVIPTLPEQQAIAKILSDLDSKIALNRSMNSTLEAIGQVLFRRWFVDFEFPDEEGKPYRSSGGEMVETELGEVPAGWEVKPFSEVIDVNPNRKLAKGKVAKKVGMAGLNAWQSWIESWQLEKYKSGPRFQNGDTLFARITPSLEHGKTAFVSFLDKDEIAFGSTEFIIFSPKIIIQSDLYIFHLTRSEDVREAAISAMTGSSGRQRVPDDLFDQLLICIPPPQIIAKFHNAISPLFEEISMNANQTRNLGKIRDTLLPKLMSGEIKVR